MNNLWFSEDKIFRFVARCYNYFFIRKKNIADINLNCDLRKIYVFTIVFNSSNLLAEQLKSVKKYFSKNMEFIVIDNSTNLKQKELTELICLDSNIQYIPLPYNKYSNGHPSYSHALALNWTMKNIISYNKIKKFGFIDSDVFPIAKTNIESVLDKQDFYGLMQVRKSIWYIWPGLCFFNLLPFKFNFLPLSFLDTGGAMYKEIYSRYKREDLMFPTQTYLKVINKISDFRQKNVEIFDGVWLHLMDGSKSYKSKIKFLKENGYI